MTVTDDLRQLVRADRELRQIDQDIYSVLPPDHDEEHLYDKQATAYDYLVGSPLYLRLTWDNRRSDYARFIASAINSTPRGWYLDAGCGSLLFSSNVYSRYTHRPVVLLDQSIEMLKRARSRLVEQNGQVPDNIVLVQGDLFDLPFKRASFSTVMSMGTLHLFHLGEATQRITRLREQLARRGKLYMVSLVFNGRGGDRWLELLHRNVQVAPPRYPTEIVEMFRGAPAPGRLYTQVIGNMMFMKLETPGG